MHSSTFRRLIGGVLAAAGIATLLAVLTKTQTPSVSYCSDPTETWLGHEGWDTPDVDGVPHHQHVEGCVPLGVTFDGVSRPFLQHFEETIVLFRRSATGVLKSIQFEAATAQILKSINPPDANLSCMMHAAGEVCTLPISADVDFSLAKCSGPQRLNIRLVYDSPTGFPDGEQEAASTYTIDIENGTPVCGASVSPITIGSGWQKEHVNSLYLNHRYPTAGVLQSQVLAAAHTPVTAPWVINVTALVGFSLPDPNHGAFIAVDPANHDGLSGCVIMDGPPIQTEDVTILQGDGTLPCLVDNGDGTFGPSVVPQTIASGWHTIAVRGQGTHDTVDNPTTANHMPGHSFSAGNFKFKFYVS